MAWPTLELVGEETPAAVAGPLAGVGLDAATAPTAGPANQPPLELAGCWGADGEVVGLATGEARGLEKLTEGFRDSASSVASSGTFDNLFDSLARFELGVAALSTLAPLPPRAGEGDVILAEGSALLARLWEALLTPRGSGGTGGALSSVGERTPLVRAWPGEGDRKVRSVIEPELLARCRPGRFAPPRMLPPAMLPAPTDETEPRRSMRLVVMLPTGSGVVLWERRAAAAAAADKAPFAGLWRKAWLAAVAAAEEWMRSTGWWMMCVSRDVMSVRSCGSWVETYRLRAGSPSGEQARHDEMAQRLGRCARDQKMRM